MIGDHRAASFLFLGKCTPHVPVFGCIAIIRQGFVTGIMCRD